MTTRVEWSGVDRVHNNIGLYGEQVRRAVLAVANYYAPIIEAYAKDMAPWQDQTGNARQALYAFVAELSQDTVAIYLNHGVEYGRYLELKHQGAYGIIMDALQEHYDDVLAMLRGIFE